VIDPSLRDLSQEVKEARGLAGAFYQLANGETAEASLAPDDREQTELKAGVSQFPMRMKGATLARHTCEAAIDQNGNSDHQRLQEAMGE